MIWIERFAQYGGLARRHAGEGTSRVGGDMGSAGSDYSPDEERANQERLWFREEERWQLPAGSVVMSNAARTSRYAAVQSNSPESENGQAMRRVGFCREAPSGLATPGARFAVCLTRPTLRRGCSGLRSTTVSVLRRDELYTHETIFNKSSWISLGAQCLLFRKQSLGEDHMLPCHHAVPHPSLGGRRPKGQTFDFRKPQLWSRTPLVSLCDSSTHPHLRI